jgi:hypothetical protein
MRIQFLRQRRRVALLTGSIIALGAACSSMTFGGATEMSQAVIRDNMLGTTKGGGPLLMGSGQYAYDFGTDHEADSYLTDGFVHVAYDSDHPLQNKKIVQEQHTGKDHLVLTEGNEVYAWGSNADGLLGSGESSPQPYATRVDFAGTAADGAKITSLVTNQKAAYVLTDAGQVVSWGRNQFGQLGQGIDAPADAPGSVHGPGDVDTAAAGEVEAVWPVAAAVILKHKDGRLTGAGDSKALAGYTQNTVPAEAVPTPRDLAPTVGDELKRGAIIQSAGSEFASDNDWWRSNLVLFENGDLVTWGYDYAGETGRGSVGLTARKPEVPSLLRNVKLADVAVGFGNVVGRSTAGEVFTWGMANEGQLGREPENEDYIGDGSPALVEDLPARATKIAAGDLHDLALLENGEVFGWGNNGTRQLGVGEIRYERPIALDVAPSARAIDVQASERVSFVRIDSSQPIKTIRPSRQTPQPTHSPSAGSSDKTPSKQSPGVAFDSERIDATGGELAEIRGTGRPGATVSVFLEGAHAGGVENGGADKHDGSEDGKDTRESDIAPEKAEDVPGGASSNLPLADGDGVGTAEVKIDGTWRIEPGGTVGADARALVATQSGDTRIARAEVHHVQQDVVVTPGPGEEPEASLTPTPQPDEPVLKRSARKG